ncbi:UDP-N-acetylglucosamine--peptide N-acetylglucosaminyltransferase 110 kDa subunit [Hondaea fermentalgiana]|uniref:UDP-N-acetylglucosamine--peptide N-acetylglucosaminyltransferase 110 kDa subunit n=1 Tax=Hondaea fermentalgiana TaxID=2315210 RepID=A0A2R5GFB3_9STRA|nr:UDP-N-acetylglucosamine--peptide N-acetylglucosaminyltransferase 110 kDa subunit [Hondaea fermentalgiana]|eukprot:GBG26931.1 UDP-N-acetylglucosamine--peptide N-acetylglucosaminyltransferase 110 kDa subunit [Hondaea fermentalgiana]
MAPALPATHYNLGCVWDDLGALPLAIAHFEMAASLKPSFLEAFDCLAGALLKRGSRKDLEHARVACEQALRLARNDSAAHWNLGSALRRLGKADEAIARAWSAILHECKSPGFTPLLVDVKTLGGNDLREAKVPQGSAVAVVCVKWGTKYDAVYVNNLRAAVSRHIGNLSHEFFCFTEDSSGVDSTTRPLPDNEWTGWWHKASVLFSGHLERHIPERFERVLYLDLDTVIVGPIQDIAEYAGPFATLYTSDFGKTEDREGGYNSSMMAFPRGCEALQAAIFGQLDALGVDHVKRFVHRLDFWLEMTVRGAASLQSLFPGRLLDFKTHVREADSLPTSASVVNFPLRPKPHEVADAAWMQAHWRPA